MQRRTKPGPVVACLNMKGGVGKTTVSAHLFRVLFERKVAETLLVDLDPQFNLSQQLFTRTRYEALKTAGKTIMNIMEAPPAPGLFNINANSATIPNAAAVSESLFRFGRTGKELRVVPGDFRLVKYSLSDNNAQLLQVKNRFKAFIDLERQGRDVICIDCNPSSSMITLCALESCTHVLVPVRPDRYSILGLELLDEYIKGIPAINPKPAIVIVLNGVSRSGHRSVVESELRSHPVFGPLTLASRIHLSNLLTAHATYTGFATDRKVPYRRQLENELKTVADELASAIGMSA